MSLRIRFLTLLLLLLCFSTARANATLYSRSFSGQEGRPTDGWQFDTTDPGYWTQHDGWLASGNGKDQVVQADGYSYAIIDTPDAHGWDDYEVRTRFWMKPASGELALVGRWHNRQNHYRAVLKFGEGSRSVQLQKVVKGQTSQLATQPVKLDQLGVPAIERGAPDKAVDFAFSLNGPELAVSLAGKPVVSAQDSTFAAGSAGFGQSQNDVYFSGIQVAQATAPAAQARPAARASSGGVYSVQLYRGTDIAFATALLRELKVKGYMPMLLKENGEVRVLVGRFGSQSEAARMKQVMILNEDYAFASVQDVSESREIGTTATTSQPDEQKTKEMVDSTLKNMDLDNLTPEQQQKVLDMVVKWRANRMNLQSVERILEIKQDITRMTEDQKKSLVTLEEKVALASNLGAEFKSLEEKVASQNPIEQVNQALKESREKELIALKLKAEEASKGDNYEEALNLWFEVSSMASLDNPAVMREASTEIKKLQAILANRPGSGGGVAAPSSGNMNLYLMIGGAGLVILAVLLFLVFQSNRKRYQALMLQMQEGGGRGPALREPAGKGKTAALGAAGMGAGMGALDFPGGDELGLLEQTDTSMADFMIPEKPSKSASKPAEDDSSLFPEMEAEPLSLDGGSGASSGGMDLGFSFGQDEKDGSEADAMSFDFGGGQEQQTPEESEPVGFSFAPTEETSGAGDSFGFDFGAGETEAESSGKSGDDQDFGFFGFDATPSTGTSEAEPEMAPALGAGGGDDMGFTFDFGGGSSSGDLDTHGAITASVFPTDDLPTPSVGSDDDLAFSFHDTVAESKAKATVEEEEVAPEEHEPLSLDFGSFGGTEEKAPEPTAGAAASEDSDSLALGDLTFNIATEDDSFSADTAPTQALPSELYSGSYESPFAEPAPAFSETPSFAMGANPLMDDGLDFGLPSIEAVPEPSIPTIKLDKPAQPLAPGVLFAQDLASDTVGQMPSGWKGEEVPDAALTVVEDPDGSGEKCLLFQKTGEVVGTSFSCHFKEVRGNIVIEYDIRCDEKNKHLLGLYVEADSDFRRSVHTVVQCTDPAKPAHLRVFTQPADYVMGQWAHIKYIVDLGEGLVDGYVDDQLVAEGVRMGTRTPVLNTLSIRDSKNTTGTLYVKNLVIRQG